ncbi:MAG: heavy metal translocating P-type ATPase [Flavobacteriales bacterium]|nr:heavy metal translocating P-type ATPase [Flavobacteriales bacterium]MCW8938922.1 heavy metal translocating P-type ATPase [Flavobacteriales bacterium]MCW8967756.1 heavy metal translocating P-type ATPase [Flavobacteriales bacterium]MCW8989849.1 heavy metal translocating P-type ATPase [Flavobacteriales bacterium]MCW9020800.1 heavy metal translocating P-type ATPase [Flavobacteriales bacterium]
MSEACSKEVCLTDEIKPKKENYFEKYKAYLPSIVSLVILLTGVTFDQLEMAWFNTYFQVFLFGMAYLIIGGPVVWKAITRIPKGDVFNEFFLMSIATIGAFFIGEYAEGVAVMLFYAVGELFQDAAVNNAKRSIESLLKLQIEEVNVVENGTTVIKHPKEVKLGEIIKVKSGEKVALDGELITEKASFNTAALTGESVPDDKKKGDTVLAGMVNLNTVAEIKITALYADTKLSKILKMVQEASGRKAKTQLFISKFAKVYTPIVVFLAVALTFLPYFIVDNYVFNDWLYRALVFLVISCPCALVISIPLGYFGGIGAASRNGILFKGSDYLDKMTEIDTVVMDKTGTLTKGVFEVQKIVSESLSEKELLHIAAAIETYSTHPIAKAIVKYAEVDFKNIEIKNVEEISGHGLKGEINNQTILAGNSRLLKKFNVAYDEKISAITDTIVLIAIAGKFAGYITIADSIKVDAIEAITALHHLNIREVVMLSGDKQSVVDKIAKQLGLDKAFGGLLPEDKVNEVSKLKAAGGKIAFIGDGINDAPVIAMSDVGMAMGGLGSDAAIETADVVIQTDHPSKIATAIKIGKATKRIVWQNIILAMGIKLIVLALGAGGIATMWEAVFADVGVALLAILNAVRIQKMRF